VSSDKRMIVVSEMRLLNDAEVALFRAGLELLVLQGERTTRIMAQAALNQNMPENMLWAK
jgi:hypothetical protein